MEEWLKSLTVGMCVITILMHLLPRGKFTKYVRFYAGLLFFLMAVRPLTQFFMGDGEFERLLQLEFLKEEYYDMETSIAGMEELKNSRIAEAYHGELYRQIREMAGSYGVSPKEVELQFDQENTYSLKKVNITAELPADSAAAACEALKDEISGLYMIEKRDISIREWRGRQ